MGQTISFLKEKEREQLKKQLQQYARENRILTEGSCALQNKVDFLQVLLKNYSQTVSKLDWEALVSEFHDGMGHPVEMIPGLPEDNIRELRKKLIKEETDELLEAMDTMDLGHIAKEMADLIFVIIGAALVYGIPITRAFIEVCKSNMTKITDMLVFDEDGKLMKPDTYKEPDMNSLIEAAKRYGRVGI